MFETGPTQIIPSVTALLFSEVGERPSCTRRIQPPMALTACAERRSHCSTRRRVTSERASFCWATPSWRAPSAISEWKSTMRWSYRRRWNSRVGFGSKADTEPTSSKSGKRTCCLPWTVPAVRREFHGPKPSPRRKGSSGASARGLRRFDDLLRRLVVAFYSLCFDLVDSRQVAKGRAGFDIVDRLGESQTAFRFGAEFIRFSRPTISVPHNESVTRHSNSRLIPD